jgi:hypothetical protein
MSCAGLFTPIPSTSSGQAQPSPIEREGAFCFLIKYS